VLLVTLAIMVSLQFGYLLGVLVRFGVASRREHTEPQEETPAAGQQAWARGNDGVLGRRHVQE
jgi:hypothetical protein